VCILITNLHQHIILIKVIYDDLLIVQFFAGRKWPGNPDLL
jgi:hypothetical protein